MKRAITIAILSGIAQTVCCDAAPTLDTIWPPGGKAGSSFDVTLTGKTDPWPCDLWFSEDGISFTPDPEKNGTGKILIKEDAELGPVLVRAYNAEGASSPLIFSVSNRYELLEPEGGDRSVTSAKPIDLSQMPMVISGRIQKDHEIDSYRVSLAKGETIHAAIESYTLRAPFDPAMHVYDAEGNRLHLIHDGNVHLDPLISFQAPEKAEYIFAIAGFAHPPAANVYFHGSSKIFYRFHFASKISDLPTRILPDSIGKDSKVEILEKDKPILATFSKGREKHRYRFTGKKGESVFVSLHANEFRFPTDPVLRIEKPDGSEVRSIDDSNKKPDPEYLWKIGEDGDFTIEVSERFGSHGPDFRYQLNLKEIESDFTLSCKKSELELKPGETVDLGVQLNRLQGHTDDIEFTISGLPKHVELDTPKDIPTKDGEVKLVLKAGDMAKGFNGPILIEGKEKSEARRKRVAAFSFEGTNYRGPYVLPGCKEIWLTVIPKEDKPKKDKK